MSNPESTDNTSTPDIQEAPEFDLNRALDMVIELGRAAVRSGEAAAFSVQLGDLARQLGRRDEENHGRKTTGYNPFKNVQ